ncbi:MAG TPA: flagellar hook capping FlgD N-terminal domain-containing protein [Myxococcota bacterium]|jgi:flagellar basal-body rod modification protein FlgD|nr:flagellar hook capping FlgD N-terminal domain-containing protein [Myxococcota bacterium]
MDLTQLAGGTSATSTTSDATKAVADRSSLGQQDFLKMLITQLENQDPLNPQDATQFTAQLAQFSSLEQLVSLRTGIDKLVSAQSGSSLLSTASLIGRQVVAQGEQFELGSGAAPQLGFSLDGAATSVRVQIQDDRGNVVRELRLGALDQGRHDLAWDGKGEGGSTLPAGVYSLHVEAAAGATAVPATTFVSGLVTGSALSNGQATLMLGSIPVALSDVEEVRAVAGSGSGA